MNRSLGLAGRRAAFLAHSTQYIQINIAPFSRENIFEFLDRFSTYGMASEAEQIRSKMAQLRILVETNDSVAELLARPVHLPMIAELLPEIRITAKDLQRARVYDAFISRVIRREISRQQSIYPTLEDHKVFAEELALLMLAKGESRSVRISEIADEFIAPFMRTGQTVDECRRKLIASSFLERKAPDILYFPHKSFAEFLAAMALINRLNSDHPRTVGTEAAMSPEVISFFREMVSKQQLRRAAHACVGNSVLIENLITVSDPRMLAVLREPDIAKTLADNILQLPKLLTFHLLQAWSHELKDMRDDPAAASIIRAADSLLTYADGAVAVLAERLLHRDPKKPADGPRVASESTASRSAAPRPTASRSAAPRPTASRSAAPRPTASRSAAPRPTASRSAAPRPDRFRRVGHPRPTASRR